MLRRLRYFTLNLSLIGALISCALFTSILVAAADVAQDELSDKVAQAVALYPKDVKGSYEKLRALGTSAIPFIVKIITDNDDCSPFIMLKRARTNPFLIDVIANMNGEQADAALIELLTSKDAITRGAAAQSLGQRQTQTAIPYLIELLDDKTPYMGFIVNHPSNSEDTARDVTLQVRDVAIEALENITGLNQESGTNIDEQAKSWRRWWQKQQRLSRSNKN